MPLLEIDSLTRVFIGIAAMVLLFGSFLVAFITSQRRKIENHKNQQVFLEQKQQMLTEQNKVLEQKVDERTVELEQQKQALQKSLVELKETQQQLVHREKMASLGEMMSGIAHEIQNPLNFINNFSEVTVEMYDELNQEIAGGNTEEIKTLQTEIIFNLKKINQHGKRAALIVKGMLQHSQLNTGKKELVNINELLDECMQLCLQSMKLKDKNFNVKIDAVLNEDVPELRLLSQDINRVLINIINNALYAVKEKTNQNIAGYIPEISLRTKLADKFVEVVVHDNGIGIPEKNKEKIFEPFFTTKPAGIGIGLGLSLSYEVIKAHNGEILVTSTEGEFTEFVLRLPL